MKRKEPIRRLTPSPLCASDTGKGLRFPVSARAFDAAYGSKVTQLQALGARCSPAGQAITGRA